MISMFRVLLLALLLLSGAAQPASAGLWEDGLAAYESRDYHTALRLWMPLARQGNASAQYKIGGMYRQGHGVPQGDAEAMKWWRLAADQGYAKAQYTLGAMYSVSQGVPLNYAEAIKWLWLAADQGYALAQADLGFMYLNGRGVPQNYVLAHMWYNLESANDASWAQRFGAQSRDEVASKMTPTQIAEAQRLAVEWKLK